MNKPRRLFSADALVINDAGNCCQGWSSEGSRGRHAHHSQHALLVWVSQRRELAKRNEEDMFFQECTPQFDIEGCLRTPLSSTHEIIDVVTGPECHGWPCSRPRRLGAGLNLNTLVWVGPKGQDEIQACFDEIFERSCQLTGCMFLQSPSAESQQWFADRMKQRGNYAVDAHAAPARFKGGKCLGKVLSSGQFQRYSKYKKQKDALMALDGTFFCDVDHWPDSPGPTPGPLLPTLLRHGTILELESGRVVMASERWLSLGFNVFEDLMCVEAGFERYLWPQRKVVLGLPERAQHSLSGNSQSLPAIMAWFLFVFCNTIRRDPGKLLREPALEAEDVSDADSNVTLKYRPAH